MTHFIYAGSSERAGLSEQIKIKLKENVPLYTKYPEPRYYAQVKNMARP